jgi:hypothetical protein
MLDVTGGRPGVQVGLSSARRLVLTRRLWAGHLRRFIITRAATDIGITGSSQSRWTIEWAAAARGQFIIPSNVAHSLANKGTGVARVIEFHTIRRPDLVPPRPAMSYVRRRRQLSPGRDAAHGAARRRDRRPAVLAAR